MPCLHLIPLCARLHASPKNHSDRHSRVLFDGPFDHRVPIVPSVIDFFLSETGIEAVLLEFEVASDGLLVVAVADFNGGGRGGRSLDPRKGFPSEKETPFLAKRRPSLRALTIARHRRHRSASPLLGGDLLVIQIGLKKI